MKKVPLIFYVLLFLTIFIASGCQRIVGKDINKFSEPPQIEGNACYICFGVCGNAFSLCWSGCPPERGNNCHNSCTEAYYSCLNACAGSAECKNLLAE